MTKKRSVLFLTALLLLCFAAGLLSTFAVRAAAATVVDVDALLKAGESGFEKGTYADGATDPVGVTYADGQYKIQGADRAQLYYTTPLQDFTLKATLTFDFAGTTKSAQVGLRNALKNTTPTGGGQKGYWLGITPTAVKLQMSDTWEVVKEPGTVALESGRAYLFEISIYNNESSDVVVEVSIDGAQVLSVVDDTETKVTNEGYFGFASQITGNGSVTVGAAKTQVEKPELTQIDLDTKAEDQTNFTQFLYGDSASITWTRGQFTLRGQNAAGLYYGEKLLNAAVNVTTSMTFEEQWHAFAMRATATNNAPTGGGLSCYFFMVNRNGATVYYSNNGAFPESNNLGSGNFVAPLDAGQSYSLRFESYNVGDAVYLGMYLNGDKVLEVIDEQGHLKESGYFGVGTYSVKDSVSIGVAAPVEDPFEGLTQFDLNDKLRDDSNFTAAVGKLNTAGGQLALSGVETTGYYNDIVEKDYVTVDARFDFRGDYSAGLFALRATNKAGAAYAMNKDAYLFAFTQNRIILHRTTPTAFLDSIAQNDFVFTNDNAVRLDFIAKNVEGGVYLAVYVDGELALEHTDKTTPITEPGYCGFMTQNTRSLVLGRAENTAERPELGYAADLDSRLISDTFFTPVGTQISYEKRQYVLGANEDTVYYTEKRLRDAIVSATVEVSALGRVGIALRATAATGAGYAQDKSAYILLLTDSGVQLYRNLEGVAMGAPITTAAAELTAGVWNLEIAQWNSDAGVRIVLWLNETKLLDYTDSDPAAITAGGYFGVSNFGTDSTVKFGVETEETPVVVPEDIYSVSLDAQLAKETNWIRFESGGAGMEFDYQDGYYTIAGVETTLYYGAKLPADAAMRFTLKKDSLPENEQFGFGVRLSNSNAALWALNKQGYYFDFKGGTWTFYKLNSDMIKLAEAVCEMDDQAHLLRVVTLNVSEGEAAYLRLEIDGRTVLEYTDYANPILAGGTFGLMTSGAGTRVTMGSGKAVLPTAENAFEGGRLLSNGGKAFFDGVTISNDSLVFNKADAAVFYGDAKFFNTELRFEITGCPEGENWFGVYLRCATAGADTKTGYLFKIFADKIELVRLSEGAEVLLKTVNGPTFGAGGNTLSVLDLQGTESVTLVLILNDVAVLTFEDTASAILESGYFGVKSSAANAVTVSSAGYDAEVEEYYLDDLLQNRDNWYGLERMPRFTEDGVRVSGNDAVAGCNNVPMGNFRLYFAYKVPELTGGQWNGIFFRTDRAGEAPFHGNNGYLIYFKADSASLVRYTNSGRTEVSLASASTGLFANVGELVEMELLVKNEVDGVRIRLIADGQTLVDYLDTDEDRIETEGLFNIFAFSGSTAEFCGTQGYESIKPLVNTNPDTGDKRPIVLALVLLVLGGAGFGATFLVKKKRTRA